MPKLSVSLIFIPNLLMKKFYNFDACEQPKNMKNQ